jgi:Tripartite tricarboxylate transporter family receptor
MLKMMAGVDLVLVHYRGDAPALTDVLGGQVQVYIGGLAGTIEHIRAGRLRALAVTTAMRSARAQGPVMPVIGYLDSSPLDASGPFIPRGHPCITRGRCGSLQWLRVGQFSIHLDCWRRPQARASLVLVHGGGGNGRLLAPYGVMAAGAGYEVVAPDLPG